MRYISCVVTYGLLYLFLIFTLFFLPLSLYQSQVEPKKLDSAAVDAMLGDEAAMSDPAVMGSVMNGLLESLNSQPADEGEKKEEKPVDNSAVSSSLDSRLSALPSLAFDESLQKDDCLKSM